MPCLTAEQIERLACDLLAADERAAVEQHLAACADCRQALEECRANEDLLREVREARQPRHDATTVVTPRAIAEAARAARQRPPRAAGIPADTFPGYRVQRELSRGGQGIVYVALQEGTNRRVAIKVLREGSYASESALQRFTREIELVAQLHHPSVVAVFHSGVSPDGNPFYVMDFVDGVSLRECVRRQRPPLERLLELFAHVCDAVEHAHLRGVIHRDLKPGNIMVDKEGRPRVLDFGLARPLATSPDQQLTVTHEVMGTLPYMSPEQARGEVTEIDTRSDIYSLGVILYELLTGEFPYEVTGSLPDVVHHITETPPLPLAQRWSPQSGVSRGPTGSLRARRCPIDDDLQTIVLKSLAKERERRYQSVTELARDIRHYLAGEAIEAKRDSTWYVLRKLARRNLAATLIVASVMVISISAAVTSYGFYRQERSARLSEQQAQTRLATQSRDFDATADQVRMTMARSRLGWFLAEWQAGRTRAAQAILARTPAHLPEHAAMRFLLDPSLTPEELLEQLPADLRGLGLFLAGERAWRLGEPDQACAHWRLCVLRDPQGALADSARARLAQHAPESGVQDEREGD